MTAKPSRSEIETALALKPRTPSNRARAKQNEADLFTEPNRRRQQVIGGDLSGVANRRYRNHLTRLKDVNVVNWVAAVIVLLILAAFFWPQTDNGSIREVANQSGQIESESFYSESRVDQPAQADPISQTFSRLDDIQRADGYRIEDAMARRIRDLHSLAEQQIEGGDYTQPNGANATNTYRQILLLSANNIRAQQGLEYIRGRFLSSGKTALENNDPDAANIARGRLASVDASSAEHDELTQAIQRWRRQKQIADLLTKAQIAQSDDNLILPARVSALYYYQQALALEQNNALAKEGIQAIADSLIAKANQAIIVGNLQTANGYLTTVSVIDPEHPSLSLMQEMITNTKTVAGNNQNQSDRAENSDTAGSNQSESEQTTTARVSDKPVSNKITPTRQSREQAAIDRKSLELGLDAYYKGDYSRAAALLQPLADRGISRAQFRIGYMYYQGRGFDANKQEADRIIRAALPSVQKFADEGRRWAQSDIGSLYEDGLVLPKDYAEAVYWYRSAAEQGYPGAQTNLGIMYARGRGVGSSRRTAIEWFQRASKQGDILAKRNLESMGIKP